MQTKKRFQERKAKQEAKRLNVGFLQIIRDFNREIQGLTWIPSDKHQDLETGRYGIVYRKHLNRYHKEVDRLEKGKKFIFTKPNRDYFEEKYNPINGTKLQ